MTVRIVIRDRCYIPIESVKLSRVKDTYQVPHPTKEFCRPGCPVANRRGKFCGSCPGRDATIKMWSHIKSPKGREFYAVPTGDLELLKSLGIKKFEVVDKRPVIKFRSDLQWKGKLYKKGDFSKDGRARPDQKKLVGTFVRHVKNGATGGLIISPPRSGKCVAGNTLIATNKGIVRIDSLFADPNRDVEQIGNYGTIVTPFGISHIRGIYSKEVDRVTELLTESGCKLVGTPNHPVLATTGVDVPPRWTTLGELMGAEFVVLPRVYPGTWPEVAGAPAVAAAGLLGYVMAFADQAELAAGVVDINMANVTDRAQLEIYLKESVDLIARSLDRALFPASRLPVPVLTTDVASKLSYAGWRALLRPLVIRALIDSQSHRNPAPYVVLPADVARHAHMFIIGTGVKCTHIAYKDEAHLVFPDQVRALSFIDSAPVDAVTGGESDPTQMILDPIATLRLVNVPTRVYDVMVPGPKSFIANGIASHNTVIGVASLFALNVRAFITASQIEFLRQFCMRFGENSNVKELYKRGRYPVVLVDPKMWKDGAKYGIKVVKKWGPEVEKADVVLSTYQQLLDTDRGRERIAKYVSGKFSFFMVDEVHQAAANAFSKLANRINIRYKLGLTATRKRKDGLEAVVDTIVGPTVITGTVTSILPRIELFETGVTSPREYKQWSTFETFLVRSEERNKIIVKQVFKDLRENPRHNVLIPTRRTEHVYNLIKLINSQAAYNRQHKGEDWPSELAVAFRGGTDTNAVMKQVAAGQARVVVANAKMVQHGLDVARWTHVYVGVIPTSNTPLVYQLGNRVCTPYPDDLTNKIGPKPEPVVRFMIDAIGASVFCFAKIFLEKELGILAGVKGTTLDPDGRAAAGPVRYKGNQKTVDRMAIIAKYPKAYSPVDVGVEKVFGLTKRGNTRKTTGWKTETKGITRL